MTRAAQSRDALLAAGLALLAGCAEVPAPPPEAEPAPRRSAHDVQVSEAVARHRQQAVRLKDAGDLAGSAIQWQIVVLLDPHDEAARRELAATQSTISRRAQENYNAGMTALRNNDIDRAADMMLKVLALEPDNADAAKALREVEKRRLSKIQAGRAARVGATAAANGQAMAAPPRVAGSAPADSYDIDQPLEMFKAGDTEGGLRDLRRYVEANPADKAGRARIGATVYDRALEVEKGSKEQALPLFEQAVSLRGDAAPGWNAHIQSLRKSLSEEYFQKGVQAFATDPALAVKQWETSLRYDPQNAKAAARIKDARPAQDRSKKS